MNKDSDGTVSGDDGLRDVQDAIDEHYLQLSAGQRRVIDQLVTDRRYAAVVSATELAREVNVSESTVTRAAQALGFAGYPDLQRRLREHFVGAVREKMANLAELGDAPVAAALQVMLEDVNNIRMTTEDLSQETIQRATDTLIGARCVYIYGSRGSYGLAVMLGTGLRILFPETRILNQSSGDLEDQLISLTPEDVLVAISFRRLDRTTVLVARHAARVGAKVIAITDHLSSSLTRLAQLVLIARVGPLRLSLSYASAASLVNALITAVSLQTLHSPTPHLQVAEQLWEDFGTFLEE